MSAIVTVSGQPRRLINQIRDRVGQINRFFPMAMLAVVILALPAGSDLLKSVPVSSVTPVIEILSVVSDESVTIRTHNFPANSAFTATMGPMGTRGINGIVVGSLDSGSGGTMDATYPIPAELKGSYQISIRLQSSGSFPYYAYNWFYNSSTGESTQPPPTQPPADQPPATPEYSGIPVFKVISVSRDTSATIETYNFPADQTFNVTMGVMGTRGIDGIVVGTLESGSGGTLQATYSIPSELQGQPQISIRAQTTQAQPYYAYSWFWNNDANVASSGTGGQSSDTDAATETEADTETETEAETEADAGAGATYSYSIPVMTITSVIRDQSVTFQTHNYPPNQSFTVTMGPMGTQGINGYPAGTFDSGQGGSFSVTMPIPGELAGSHQISIRAQTPHAYPFVSYNWFYNNSTP